MTAVSNMPDMTRKEMAVSARHRLYLRVAFHAEKTRSKPLERAIYTVFYRLINGLHRSDPAYALGIGINIGLELTDLVHGSLRHDGEISRILWKDVHP